MATEGIMKIGLSEDKKFLIVIDTRPFAPTEPLKIPVEQIKELLRRK